MAPNSFFVIAHNVRSLYNVGSIFRTADAFGITKIFLTGYTGTPKNPRLAPYINFDSRIFPIRHRYDTQANSPGAQYHNSPSLKPKRNNYQSSITGLKKTALGAETVIPWEHRPRLRRLIGELKSRGICIVALENNVPGTIALAGFRPRFPLALLIGEEVRGSKKEFLKLCDTIVEIPMLGSKESLNVAVAFGIATYYISEKRKMKSAKH